MNKLLLAASAIGLIISSGAASAADSAASRIDRLEKELQLLKRQQEVSDEKASAVAEKNANVEIGKKGLSIVSPDKKYQFETHGVFQFDNRSFVGDTNSTGRNENIVRKARPILTFKAGDALLYFMPDFAGTSSNANNTKIMDAYADYKFNSAVKIRVGKFKPPVGLEELQPDADVIFNERGYAANLAPARDVGAQISGDILPDSLEYQVGVFNGNQDLGNSDGDNDDRKDFAARLFAKPFRNSSLVTLQGLGFGIGGSIGDREGSATNRILPSYVTPGQQTFFSYSSTSFASGEQWRLSPQAYWYSGNKGILAEYAVSNQNVKNATTTAELQNTAWNVVVSYVLTGEDIKYSGGVKPAHDFNPGEKSWGAWEVIARAGGLTIDSAAFPTFASIATSAKQAKSYGGGLNWYLNENLKIATNYNFTEFDGGASGGKDRPEEHVIQSRLQIRF